MSECGFIKQHNQNFKILQDYGYYFLGPEKGEKWLVANMEKVKCPVRDKFMLILKITLTREYFKKENFKALVTTGPTREYLDPVRYISNESSGKQGYEIALALKKLGIKTKLISGPSNLSPTKNLTIKKIVSAEEMFREVKKSLPVDVAICAAAVSDFKPIKKSKQKLKKSRQI